MGVVIVQLLVLTVYILSPLPMFPASTRMTRSSVSVSPGDSVDAACLLDNL